ncbi:thiamine phosphate synthase [Sagittula sp. NFXS13]|uniref:thiamine phosphate synthase n=1 Tax=Sagittula sp. NFXS13 TaxID=2819095 RepID=UPI0032DE7EDF
MIPSLCFVTDAEAPWTLLEQAEQAARGGALWVQLRHKTLADAAFADLACQMMDRLSPLGAKLIVNDRTEIARAIGAAGLHIGQSDGDPRAARARIGPEAILGLSIESAEQAAAVPPGCVDYLGVGPVRATASKPDHAPPLGWTGLADIVSRTALPCMAIGGLGPDDATQVRRAGCAGMAVVSAISRATNPEAAAQTFVQNWNET